MLGILTFADAFFRGTRMSHCHVWTMALQFHCTYRSGCSIPKANSTASKESSATFLHTFRIANSRLLHLSGHQGLTALASCRNDATCWGAKIIFTRNDEQNASWYGISSRAPLMDAGGTERLSTNLNSSTDKMLSGSLITCRNFRPSIDLAAASIPRVGHQEAVPNV